MKRNTDFGPPRIVQAGFIIRAAGKREISSVTRNLGKPGSLPPLGGRCVRPPGGSCSRGEKRPPLTIKSAKRFSREIGRIRNNAPGSEPLCCNLVALRISLRRVGHQSEQSATFGAPPISRCARDHCGAAVWPTSDDQPGHCLRCVRRRRYADGRQLSAERGFTRPSWKRPHHETIMWRVVLDRASDCCRTRRIPDDPRVAALRLATANRRPGVGSRTRAVSPRVDARR